MMKVPLNNFLSVDSVLRLMTDETEMTFFVSPKMRKQTYDIVTEMKKVFFEENKIIPVLRFVVLNKLEEGEWFVVTNDDVWYSKGDCSG